MIMHEHWWPDDNDPSGELCSWPRPTCAFCLTEINPPPKRLEDGSVMYPGYITMDSPAGRLAFHQECAQRYLEGEEPL